MTIGLLINRMLACIICYQTLVRLLSRFHYILFTSHSQSFDLIFLVMCVLSIYTPFIEKRFILVRFDVYFLIILIFKMDISVFIYRCFFFI